MAADGPRALAVVGPLAVAVWSYDLVLKSTSAGTAGMSACRGLDVMVGSGGSPRALPAAAVVAAHIAVVTEVSRREVDGRRSVGRAAARWPPPPRWRRAGALLSRGRLAALGLLGAYATVVGRAHADAARDPSPARLQRAVGAGILGLMPLEAGLLAGAGALVPAAGVASLWPLARRAARKRAVT